jgi:hypothetical protein
VIISLTSLQNNKPLKLFLLDRKAQKIPGSASKNLFRFSRGFKQFGVDSDEADG